MISATFERTTSSSERLHSGDSSAFDALWAQIASIGLLLSVCSAAAYYPARLGLSTPHLLIPACVLIVGTALFAPLLLPLRGRFGVPRLRSAAMPLVSLLVMASVALALLLRALPLVVYALLFLGGLWRAVRILRGVSGLQRAFLVCTGCVAGFYLFATVQPLNYAGIYTPEQAFLGILNHDTEFHAAIAHLIQNFGVPSLGVDGIIPIRYHFGTHYWFAGLARLTGSDPMFAYGAGVSIILVPMLVTAVLLAAAALDLGRRTLAVYVIVGLGLVFLSDMIGWNSYYISESYTYAVMELLLLLPLLALLADETRLSPRQQAAGFVVAIAVIPLLTVSKISVGALWTAALGWVVLRRYGLGKRAILTGVAAGLVFLAVFRLLSPSPGDYRSISNSLIVPLFFFRLYGISGLSSLAIPAILLLSKTRLYGGEGLRAVVSSKSDLMFEVAMVVTVVGAIPPMTGVPQDSAVWYFLNVGQWVAMPLLAVRLVPRGFAWPDRTVLLRAFPLVAIAALGVVALLPNVYKQAAALAEAANMKSGGKYLHGQTVARHFYETFRREHTIWGGDFREILAASPGEQLIQAGMKAIPIPDRRTAVFISPQNLAFWDASAGCQEKFNLQVALTGQPALLGAPPASYGCDLDVYTSDYGTGFKSRDMSDADLCAHARQRDIAHVLIVADSRPGGQSRMLNCSGGIR